MASTPRRRRYKKGGVFLFVLSAVLLVTGIWFLYSGLVEESGAWEEGASLPTGVLMVLFGVAAAIGGAFSLRYAGTAPERAVPARLRGWRQFRRFPRGPLRRGPRGWPILRPQATRTQQTIGLFIGGLVFAGGPAYPIYLNVQDTWDLFTIFTVVFLSIFVLVGLLLLGAAVRALLTGILVSSTRVEISKEPVQPGESFRLALHQPGDFPITRTEVSIICTEIAQWTEGGSKNTRTVRRESETYRHTIATIENTRASHHAPLLEAEAHLPADAMHSFETQGARIVWAAEVRLVIPRRPDVKDLYLFRVV